MNRERATNIIGVASLVVFAGAAGAWYLVGGALYAVVAAGAACTGMLAEKLAAKVQRRRGRSA